MDPAFFLAQIMKKILGQNQNLVNPVYETAHKYGYIYIYVIYMYIRMNMYIYIYVCVLETNAQQHESPREACMIPLSVS